MRVTLSISLVILLLLNLFGFYVAYYIKLDKIQDEIEETLSSNTSKLQVVTLSSAQYKQVQWTKPGKECRINGTMYDVAKIEFSAGGVKLFVKADEEETTLDSDFAQNFQSKQELPASPVKLLVSMIGQDFITVNYKLTVPPVATSTIFQLHTNQSMFAEFIMEKISPPPWC